jgi:hypothetical protein
MNVDALKLVITRRTEVRERREVLFEKLEDHILCLGMVILLFLLDFFVSIH